MTVVHAVLAAADSIDGCEVLRAGATGAVMGHAVLAPSTIGTCLRSFSWAHARSWTRWPASCWAGRWARGAGRDDPARAFTVDLDSSIHETYGLQKEGGCRFSYTQVRGYHPLYALAGEDGQVLHSRLRGGNCHAARGAVGFLRETFSRVRPGGVTGPLQVRADSGFYSKKVVQACQKAGARWSITVKMYKNVHAAISTIPEQAWQPIPYWFEEGGADVAVIPWAAFKSATDNRIPRKLVVRRVKPTPGSQLALLATYSYHAFILRHEALLVRVGGKEPTSGLSQQAGEAEGSLILHTQGRLGAALTTTGRPVATPRIIRPDGGPALSRANVCGFASSRPRAPCIEPGNRARRGRPPRRCSEHCWASAATAAARQKG